MPDDVKTASAKISTMQPFAPGDVLVGATDLNVPEDDHAGDGRIFQFGADLKLKGILYTQGSTHLVKGLQFGPDGLLWAFDSSEHLILWVDPKTGKQVWPGYRYPARPWSSCFWDKAGNLYLHEHTTGTWDSVAEKFRHMMRKIPGTNKIGDGNVYKFAPDGNLLATFETETSTSFAGFLGVTSCLIHPSETHIVYTTETCKRIMRFDVVNNRQMPDLMQLPQDQPEYVFCLGRCEDGTILATRGAKWEQIDEDGKVVRRHPLEGRGWAAIREANDPKYVWLTNFFSGQAMKVEKESGKTVGTFQVPVQRALAGIAEYKG